MNNQERLYRYQVYTLVDITDTGITQTIPGKEKERNQQRNLETVLQVIGLKTQAFEIGKVFQFEDIELDKFNFGSYYLSEIGFKYNVWSFSWSVEFENAYQIDNDPYGTLINDFDKVPALFGLNEKITLPPHNLFYPIGQYKNIYFIKETRG